MMLIVGHYIGCDCDTRLVASGGRKKDFTVVSAQDYRPGAEFGFEDVANMLMMDGLTPGDKLKNRDGIIYTVVEGSYKRLKMINGAGQVWAHRKVYA